MYFSAIGLRLSFIVGVSSSPPGSHSVGRILNFLICSTRASCSLAASISSWTAAITFSLPDSSAASGDAPTFSARPGMASGSSVTSALLNWRASPMVTAWPMSGPAALIFDSMFAGDMFLPAALMISSFLRSTIFR